MLVYECFHALFSSEQWSPLIYISGSVSADFTSEICTAESMMVGRQTLYGHPVVIRNSLSGPDIGWLYCK